MKTLRWDLNFPVKGGNGTTLYGVNSLNNLADLALAPDGAPLWKTTYHNFAPRIGLAYDISNRNNRELVLRGGFGIFYDLGAGQSGDVVLNPPNESELILPTQPFPVPAAQAQPAPFGITPPFGFFEAFDPSLRAPRTYQWNLASEQSLGTDQALTVTYLGAAGRQLLQTSLYSPNPTFQFLSATRSTGTSDYDALQVQYRRRMSHGLQALASYTWSHSIDTASNDFEDLSVARGPSDFDLRHSVSGTLQYDIPTPQIGGAFGALVRDWSISSIFQARSAFPVNLVAEESALGGTGQFENIRPNLVSGVSFKLNDPTAPGGWRFNPQAFTIPPPDANGNPVQGDLARNALRGFPLWQLDFAVRRQFNLSDRFKAQFRAELFNLFNHPNFGSPDPLLTSPTFGESTQMFGQSLTGLGSGFNPLYQVGGPRSVQLALRINF